MDAVFTATSGRLRIGDPIQTPSAFELHQANLDLIDALFAQAPLSNRIIEGLSGKNREPHELDAMVETESQNRGGLYVLSLVHRLLADSLDSRGFDYLLRAGFQSWEAVESDVLRGIQSLSDRGRNHYRVLALLNGPIRDTLADEILLRAPTSHGDVTIALAPATDAVLARFVEGVGYARALPAGTHFANTVIKFVLSVPVDAPLSDYVNLYPTAAYTARAVLDVLRIVHGGDIGISVMLIEPMDFWTPHVPRDRAWDFQPESAAFIPRRTAFIAPSELPMSDEQLEECRALLLRYSPSKNVKGFDVAIRRFRDAWERYHAFDPERLLDIAIALEAIYLNDSDDNKELRFRLALRGARFLERDFERRLEVFHTIQSLYDIRSAIAHGATTSLKPAQQAKMDRVLRGAPEILRRSLRKLLLDEGPTGLEGERLVGWWRGVELS